MKLEWQALFLTRTDRIVSANTHFEKWWFETFLCNTAKAAYTLKALISKDL